MNKMNITTDNKDGRKVLQRGTPEPTQFSQFQRLSYILGDPLANKYSPLRLFPDLLTLEDKASLSKVF